MAKARINFSKDQNRMIRKRKNNISKMALLALFSLLAGAINGFLGTGGGIVLVYALGAITDNDKKDNFAITLCAIIPMSLVSLISYGNSGNIDTSLVKTLIFPAVIGGALGALLTDKIRTKYLSLFFALLVMYSGICMVVR